jgi:ATP-binding cassette, subfamily B (MDR/TAP), member 1
MVFDVIDRVPLIRDKDAATTNSHPSFELNDGIHFKNVTFKYPTAHAKLPNVLTGVDFTIKAGTTTAIVGPSGSGKSTIIQMVERFYDPVEGDISMDTTNIKDLSLKTLRESIGYVS